MSTFYNLIVVLQVLSALVIIGLVLLQHGKGADMGAAFGSGASGSLFGASGSSNFMSKSTGVAAAIFFASTLSLAYFSKSHASGVSGGVLDRAPVATKPAAPAPGSQVPGTVAAPAPATGAAPAASAPAASAPAAPVNQIPK